MPGRRTLPLISTPAHAARRATRARPTKPLAPVTSILLSMVPKFAYLNHQIFSARPYPRNVRDDELPSVLIEEFSHPGRRYSYNRTGGQVNEEVDHAKKTNGSLVAY